MLEPNTNQFKTVKKQTAWNATRTVYDTRRQQKTEKKEGKKRPVVCVYFDN